jgi:hypothetical protein
MKQKKVVKTFTVDEGVYNWLVEIMKKADIGIGVSNLLDGYLKYIYQGLREVLYYIEKNKIDLPTSYVVHRFLDDHTLFFMYDWEFIEKLEKGKKEDFKKMVDDETRIYVDGLIEDYEKKYKRKWKKPLKEILGVDRKDR